MPFLDEELMRRLPEPGNRTAKFAGVSAAFLRRFRDVAATRAYDAVFVHRGISLVGPAVFERLVAWIGRPVIYDFDDAIYLTHTTEANRGLGWLKFAGKTASICALAATAGGRAATSLGATSASEWARVAHDNAPATTAAKNTSRIRARRYRAR